MWNNKRISSNSIKHSTFIILIYIKFGFERVSNH